ncbi:Uu.00g001200.m01.CDS01 [Anthostomella pinea]|uniref:Uu.00g001200.m01.CDS01 n=1 Tax=Anthostomella pinea TaxID=933095 RepID=A0AAI8VJB6_9PEZI|nr:Uu.00g001200.m01.CDS01 [Anthostomella pinea]
MAPQNSRHSAHPPSLPPTVEEAYRRKCIQLKDRSREIEEENDAYRLRLARLKRQIQKSRLERAILLEQISKRTSTNVEDSEGSPSPPPTDKPLRTKRGHRKSSLLPGGDGDHVRATFINHNPATLSPSSDAFSHSQMDSQRDHGRAANGAAKPPKRPSNAFEIYCNDNRPILAAENREKIAAGEFRLEEELARGWKDLPESEREEFAVRYSIELARWKEARENFKQGLKEAAARERSRGRDHRGGRGRTRFEEIQDDDGDDDQDVEMAEAEADPEPLGDQDTDPETEIDDNDGGLED